MILGLFIKKGYNVFSLEHNKRNKIIEEVQKVFGEVKFDSKDNFSDDLIDIERIINIIKNNKKYSPEFYVDTYKNYNAPLRYIKEQMKFSTFEDTIKFLNMYDVELREEDSKRFREAKTESQKSKLYKELNKEGKA